MDTCAHANLELSLDRWQECHWFLHQMEANYHEPEPVSRSVPIDQLSCVKRALAC